MALYEQPFKAVVSSRIERGEEHFRAEIWMVDKCCVLATDPQENFQGVLGEVLDWSRRQGKTLTWEYQLAKGSRMKRLIGESGHGLRTDILPANPGIYFSLGATECDALDANEAVIRRGLNTFLEVGRALINIRDRRLYRGGYLNFEDYVEKRWQMSVRHAHRMCDAAEIVQNLLPAGEPPPGASNQLLTAEAPLPTKESQARPLKGLEPEQQRQVWHEAVKSVEPGDEVTATDVKQARNRLHPPPENQEFKLELAAAPQPQSEADKIRLLADQAIKQTKELLDAADANELPLWRSDLRKALQLLQHFRKEMKTLPKRVAKVQKDVAKRWATAKPKTFKPLGQTDQFVLCRTNQDGQATFRTERGGWTVDPDKAVHYKNATEAKFSAHHAWDKPMSLSKARRKVQFKL